MNEAQRTEMRGAIVAQARALETRLSELRTKAATGVAIRYMATIFADTNADFSLQHKTDGSWQFKRNGRLIRVSSDCKQQVDATMCDLGNRLVRLFVQQANEVADALLREHDKELCALLGHSEITNDRELRGIHVREKELDDKDKNGKTAPA